MKPFYDLIVTFKWFNWIKMNVNARNRVYKPFNESKLKKAVCGLLGPFSSRVDLETSFRDNRDLVFNYGQCHSNRGAISSLGDDFEFWAQDRNPARLVARVRAKAQKANPSIPKPITKTPKTKTLITLIL